MRSRFIVAMFLGFVVAGCALTTGRFDPTKHTIAGEGTGDFTFIVLGDSRPDGHLSDKTIQPEGFFRNMKRANEYDHDFVVDVGDLVLGYCETDLLIREWDAFDEAIKGFDKPFVMVAGNHDVWTPGSEKIWLDRYGPLHFSWDHKGCHFIVLDSEKVGEMDSVKGEQLEWLKADLESSKGARRTFVFIHKPLWAYDHGNWNVDIHPLLVKYGVDTVFAGHWHEYSLHPAKDGIRYVVTGGGGAEIGDDLGSFHHILVVRVEGKESDFKVVTPTEEFPPEIVTREAQQAIRNALTIRPIAKPGKGGTTAVVIEVSNPMKGEARGVIEIGGEGTSWESARTEILVPAGGKLEVRAETVIKGDVFPLPQCHVDVKVGNTRLILTSFFPDISLLAEGLPFRPLDDFEDGDLKSLSGTNGFSSVNGTWEVKCDEFGKSRIDPPRFEDVEIDGKRTKVLHISGFHGKSADPKWCWASIESWLAGPAQSVDITPSIGVSFKARSATESTIRMTVEGTVAGKRLVAKGAAHARYIKVGKDWQTYRFYWHEYKQEPWVCPGENCVDAPLAVDKVEYLNWGFRDEDKEFDLLLDDVALMYESGRK